MGKQSDWLSVTKNIIKQPKPITFGEKLSNWYYQMPDQLLSFISYYKFAAKLIGKEKQVLDIGCGEGLGTFLLGKECGFARGVSFNQEMRKRAENNFSEKHLSFVGEDFFITSPKESWDAITSFSLLENTLPLENLLPFMTKKGLLILGEINKNSFESIEKEMKQHFTFVFLFGANSEIIHPGISPSDTYLLFVGCKKR